MPKFQQDAEAPLSDAVNLLVSILVRYPEIGSINFEPSKQTLKFTFLLTKIPSPELFAATKQLLHNSITAYHLLAGHKPAICDIELTHYDKVSLLTINRDVSTLTKGELTLVITLVREKLKELLVTDNNDAMLEEDLLLQEEVIETMLQSIKAERANSGLIGIREDGRVFVYNK